MCMWLWLINSGPEAGVKATKGSEHRIQGLSCSSETSTVLWCFMNTCRREETLQDVCLEVGTGELSSFLITPIIFCLSLEANSKTFYICPWHCYLYCPLASLGSVFYIAENVLPYCHEPTEEWMAHPWFRYSFPAQFKERSREFLASRSSGPSPCGSWKS